MPSSRPHRVLVNTLTGDDDHNLLDPITRVFIKAEAAVGINRLHLLEGQSPCSKKLYWMAGIYCYIMVIFCAYISDQGQFHVKTVLDISAYFFNVVFSFVTAHRLKLYFREINTFDKAVCCRPKYSELLKQNVMLHIMVALVMAGAGATFFIRFWNSKDTYTHIIIIHIQRVCELYFYAHLFCIIEPRLKLINFYVASSRTNTDNDTVWIKPEGFVYFSQTNKSHKEFTDMKFLMDLYEILVTAHRHLVNAIKWQFLITIISSFGITLATSYQVALQLLQKTNGPPVDIVKLLPAVFFVGGNVLVLAVPCARRDQLQAAVRRLRALLASALYHHHLDKRSRVSARALLSLTGAHGLGVSLLGMLRVDISLPLHYVSLLVTYLIILLQFNKVNRA